MSEIIHCRSSIINHNSGVALLMVLLIVLAVTIISAGFIARTDVELACGENMLMRVQLDQLAYSSLEYTKGLLLRPQGVPAAQTHPTDWYWRGCERMPPFGEDPDYYDVTVERDATDYCTYNVACEAYRERGGEPIGRTALRAGLRLDPCIALWTKVDTTFRKNWVLHGDMRTDGSITNQAPATSLDGDVFTTQLTPAGASVGQVYGVADLPSTWTWPPVTSSYANPNYYPAITVFGTLSGSYTPARVRSCSGNLILAEGTTIEGMLRVTGNLTVAGGGCKINGARNLPALYVGGDLLLNDANDLTVTGLAVVDGNLLIHAGAHDIAFVGGLCVAGAIRETTPDASGNGNRGTLMNDPQWATDDSRNVLQFDGTDDYVRVPHDPSLCVDTEVTVMAWIKTPRYAFPGHSFQGILAKSDNPRSYSLYTTSSGNLHFSTGSLPYVASVSSGVIPLNEWVHVCAMVRGGAHLFFINGAPAGSEGSGVTLPGASDTAPVLIGRTSENSREFGGLMDDIRIYNRALGDAEVADVANHVHVSDGLVGHWKLDGPGSSVIIQADPIKAAIIKGISFTSLEYWSPAAGAFFRTIERQ